MSVSDEKLRKFKESGLQFPEFESEKVSQAMVELRGALGVEADKFDKETLTWFLKSRRLDVEEAKAKLLAYDAWLEENQFRSIMKEDVADMAAKGMTEVLPQKDVLGRPVVLVKVAKHYITERDLQDTKRYCVYLFQEAVKQMPMEYYDQDENSVKLSFLTVWDLRNFGTLNADIPFLKFFIDVMFKYYPKRVSQVLLIEPPLVFTPVMKVIQPLMGKYATLIQTVSVEEAEEYLGYSLPYDVSELGSSSWW